MNVPTDHTAAAAVTRERGNLVLKFPDEAYGLFDASFDRLAEGKIFFAAKRAKPVIEAIQAQEERVAGVAEVR